MLTINRLSHSDALILIDGAREKSREIGIPMCISIVDESGNLVAFERMDGGKITSITISQDKAFTAAAAKKATHEYNAANVPGNLVFGIHTEVGGRLSSVGGGLPVLVAGEVVGGIGLSSGSPAQDMECAEAGLQKFYKTIE
ncbi:MAG: heme-binding protein [Sneathiella sp.]|uniref:GlcG/HbpS family heme-binding protein n=1 Tax=Sneathiella sp. TaxID=1964365 RepID=UPI0030020332